MNDRQLLEAFESCSLTQRQWDHTSHIRVGYLYLSRFDWHESLERMVSGIKKLNSTLAIPENQRRGFHFTITVAWLLLARERMYQDGVSDDSRDFIEQHPELTDRRLPMQYYSDSVLFSSLAKVQFVAPDLKPFVSSTHEFDKGPRMDDEAGRNATL
jgi:hypothetical protein